MNIQNPQPPHCSSGPFFLFLQLTNKLISSRHQSDRVLWSWLRMLCCAMLIHWPSFCFLVPPKKRRLRLRLSKYIYIYIYIYYYYYYYQWTIFLSIFINIRRLFLCLNWIVLLYSTVDYEEGSILTTLPSETQMLCCVAKKPFFLPWLYALAKEEEWRQHQLKPKKNIISIPH